MQSHCNRTAIALQSLCNPNAITVADVWQAFRNGVAIRCTGTAFNCPGAHDGARGHVTADIKKVKVITLHLTR